MQHVASPTGICNLALDAVPANRITSLAEDSLEAQKCALQYPQVFAETLETWPWNFARKREGLPEVINDRKGEWLYAYALPANMALPLGVWPFEEVGLASSGYTNQPMRKPSWDFDILGGKLYTDAKVAILEHLDYSVAPPKATAMFVRTVALKLASRICLPLTKSQRREQALLEQAEIFEQRARAHEANSRPQTYGDFIPEAVRYRLDMGDPGVSSGDYPMLGNTGDGGPTPNPGGGGTTTPPPDDDLLYTFPDWSAQFEAALNF